MGKHMNHILTGNGWWMLNKAITHQLGIDAALLLADLISKYEYFKNRDMLEDDTFFNLRGEIEADTTIPIYRQNKAIKILQSKKLLEISNKGIPPKTRFKLNLKNIKKLVNDSYY
jgi:hypothetical protein